MCILYVLYSISFFLCALLHCVYISISCHVSSNSNNALQTAVITSPAIVPSTTAHVVLEKGQTITEIYGASTTRHV